MSLAQILKTTMPRLNLIVPMILRAMKHFCSKGFGLISDRLAQLDQVFVDTKFEFGYVTDADGDEQLIYMDEVGTPRFHQEFGMVSNYVKVMLSKSLKKVFVRLYLNYFPDPDILLNKSRMPERLALAKDNALPVEMMLDVSATYTLHC